MKVIVMMILVTIFNIVVMVTMLIVAMAFNRYVSDSADMMALGFGL